jgi:hypothetical protein
LDEGAKWGVKSNAVWMALKIALKLGEKEVALKLIEAVVNK